MKQTIEHFPVSQLPEALRGGFGTGGYVRVTVETETEDEKQSLLSFLGGCRGLYPTPEDAVNSIRKLRDEWER